MARKATGQVIAPRGKQRSWALRFTAYGDRRYLTLGRPRRVDAAACRSGAAARPGGRGAWDLATGGAGEAVEGPAECRLPRVRGGVVRGEPTRLGPADRGDYRWALTHHLLPHFQPGGWMKSPPKRSIGTAPRS